MVRGCRPKQWLKNLLVFAAPAAAGVLDQEQVLIRASVVFVAFCLVSSAMYLVNDVVDRDHDATVLRKRQRPVASGELSVRAALSAAAVLGAVGIGAAASLGWAVTGVVAGYAALTTAYSLWLKPIAVLDMAAVALGFVLRAVGGGLATNVQGSEWFLLLISFGALFVVAGKRYGEIQLGEPVDGSRRPAAYTAPYLRFVWTTSAAVAVAAYCLWAFSSPQSHHAPGWAQVSAIPFVLAVLRYALMVESGRGEAPEEIMLTDRVMQGLILVWLATYLVGVYVAG